MGNRYFKYIFLICIAVLFPMQGFCTAISGGTILYLDVSSVWSNYTAFSAEFFQKENNNSSVVQMSPVPNDPYVWEVTAPAGVWDYVTFRCHNNGINQIEKQTDRLEWCGSYPLFRVLCENGGRCNESTEGGLWLNFLPMPVGKPTTADSISISEVCVEETSTLQINPFEKDEFVNLQWFDYHNGTWSRIPTRDARLTVNLHDLKNDTVYYYFKGVRLVNNLVPNPDFEQGNTGFVSDYSYIAPTTTDALFPTGLYTITDDIGKVHSMHPLGGYDHTYGDARGHCMAFNGGNDPSKRVWSVTIDNIKPNTTYVFSAWVMAWASGNLAKLQFSVNGEVLGGVVSPSGGEYVWTQLYTYWNSGNATNATITLLNFQTAGGGNDFAIDDVFFSEVEEYSCLHKVCVKHCNECSVRFSEIEKTNIDCESGTYTLQGEVHFDNPDGDLYIVLDDNNRLTFTDPISPLQFLFENLPIDYKNEKTHSISVAFSGDNTCSDNLNFTAPVCQKPCPTPKDSFEYISMCDTLLPFLWHGQKITEEKMYYDTLHNNLCDSVIFQLQFSIETCTPTEPPTEPETCISGLIYTKWTNVLFCDNSSRKYVGYQWYNNGAIIEGQTKQYLYIPEGLSGMFSVKLSLKDGSTEWACPLDYSEIPRSADIPYDKISKIRLYDSRGRLIYNGSMENINAIYNELPHGIYIIFTETDNIIQTNKLAL